MKSSTIEFLFANGHVVKGQRKVTPALIGTLNVQICTHVRGNLTLCCQRVANCDES